MDPIGENIVNQLAQRAIVVMVSTYVLWSLLCTIISRMIRRAAVGSKSTVEHKTRAIHPSDVVDW